MRQTETVRQKTEADRHQTDTDMLPTLYPTVDLNAAIRSRRRGTVDVSRVRPPVT